MYHNPVNKSLASEKKPPLSVTLRLVLPVHGHAFNLGNWGQYFYGRAHPPPHKKPGHCNLVIMKAQNLRPVQACAIVLKCAQPLTPSPGRAETRCRVEVLRSGERAPLLHCQGPFVQGNDSISAHKKLPC